MEIVSGHGMSVTIVALRTFPQGFTLSTFADDVMPIEFAETQIADHEFLVDGTLFDFDTAAAISVKIGAVPGSDDDINLNALLHARRGSTIKIAGVRLPDTVAMTISYPHQSPIVLSGGYIRSGPVGTSMSEIGRGKGNVYEFVFGESTTLSLKSMVQAALNAAQDYGFKFPDIPVSIPGISV